MMMSLGWAMIRREEEKEQIEKMREEPSHTAKEQGWDIPSQRPWSKIKHNALNAISGWMQNNQKGILWYNFAGGAGLREVSEWPLGWYWNWNWQQCQYPYSNNYKQTWCTSVPWCPPSWQLPSYLAWKWKAMAPWTEEVRVEQKL